MNIKHRPTFDTSAVEEFYTKKDGVPVKYVCTSALGDEAYAGDIFYRDTPHPKFGNKYFQLFIDPHSNLFCIRAADKIEEFVFTMIQDYGWHYSQHRHDFITHGHGSIDGGRAYTRIVGNPVTDQFLVINGEFVHV